MSDWASIEAAANASMLRAFGEPVIYQAVQAGQPVGDPITVVAIRHARVPAESGAVGNVEEISVNPPDFPSLPQRGDWITAWGLQFVIGPMHQPDPYGLVALALMMRAGQTPNG